ncbi:tautomerase family protein [Streptomyces spinoverrucosus]|uniref:tautomerase family protein n=1 Tax=Streptomyces spinoverrucosus TaxID=284043 RepID=UPI0018C38ED8|nr:tautomerase family protein [Streptomyces spinoverrucosus]MBG0851397.1 tautomerase family protein [Streptomyces spinoverrucosus]
MPIYACTTAQGTLTAETKAQLAAEITRIHVDINHVPPAFVNVFFSELPKDSVFVGGEPGVPLLLTGWARRGHPQEETTRLALELSAAVSRIAGVQEKDVLVVIQDSPARSAVAAGRSLPEPGEEKDWLRTPSG